MKRISLVASLIAAGLLATMAFGASSASATTLCNTMYGWDGQLKCKYQYTYQVGSEFAFDATAQVALKDNAGFNIVSCSASELDMTMTDDGGGAGEAVKTNITNFTFSGCKTYGKSTTITVPKNGSTTITQVGAWLTDGRVQLSGNQIEFQSIFGAKCVYSIDGAAILTGPEPSGFETTRLKFDKTVTSKTTTPQCPVASFYATYEEPTHDIWTTYWIS